MPGKPSVGRPAFAQISLEGEWNGRYLEDQMDRVPGGDWGDYTGLPINEAARYYADSWDISRMSVPEHQCQVYNIGHIFRGPVQFRIWNERDPDSQELVAIKMYLGTYEQWRTIWLDGRPHPADYMPHTWMGFSTGEWHGDDLVVTTTHIKSEYLRREGIPYSDRLTVTEHWLRHGNVITHVMIATDPVYLTEPMINTEEFVTMDREQHELALQLRDGRRSPAAETRRAELPRGQESRTSRTSPTRSASRRKRCGAARRRCIRSTARSCGR